MFQSVRRVPWDSEKSIKEEVFGVERFAEHAKSLARSQSLTNARSNVQSLSSRLSENERILLDVHKNIGDTIAAGRAVTPAAEWIFNNSHVVEAQIHAIRNNLPREFADQLPKLGEGPFAGYARIFGIAWAFVAHTDGRFERELLVTFCDAYQVVQPLQISELWALPQMIQLVMVENLRRAGRRIVTTREQRKEAATLADRILAEPDVAQHQLNPKLLTDEYGELRHSFIAELWSRLADGSEDAGAHAMLTAVLSELHLTADDIVRRDHQGIASTNNTVRHIIRSLRLISDMDWKTIFEECSLVDRVLEKRSTFREMDFATRNSYRDAIEAYARRSPLSEQQIAKLALELADAQNSGSKQFDPGFYLVGAGSRQFRRLIGARYRLRDAPALVARKGGLAGYVSSILFLTAFTLALPVLALIGQAVPSEVLWALGLCGIIPAMDLAIAIVNQAITHEVRPRIIPGMELRHGVPDTARTLVAIPTLISDIEGTDELVARLETHHLATQQDNVFFAVVSDWTDSHEAITENDGAVADHLYAAITHLNTIYPANAAGEPRFYAFHRARAWNPAQSVWMGWERKRGKLHELNRLLRGATDTTYLKSDLGRTAPANIKYIITLDSDTRLPRDAARRMIGKMLHPLNKPEISPELQRVVEGYGLLQPRVTPTLPTDQDASVFQNLFSSGGGIDPYAGAVSDVYQDLFQEGSFTGKGIYDIDAFEAVTANRFPENRILSHDLIEGLYARAGLATDIEVVEEFPSRYDVSRSRNHRWTRGDWQLLPWIINEGLRANLAPSNSSTSSLSALGRWKLSDNLRRSLSPVATLAALVLAWLLPVKAAVIWTLFLVASIVLPTFLSIIANIGRTHSDTTLRSHFAALAIDARLAMGQSAFYLITLADRSYANIDAIVRTLYRMSFSGKDLLEWTTAAQAKSTAATTVSAYYDRMLGSVVATAISALALWKFDQGGVVVATPFLAAWFAAPAIVWWVSFTSAGKKHDILEPENRLRLRETAWQTWLYFETFVTEKDNFLPPDNYQEDPRPVIAHRTSPTNIGLYLLSTVSAERFGWISKSDAANRIEQVLRSLSRMERHNGHFFNWYDTETLEVLRPRYISTVDSGNLAGHLFVVASACGNWSLESHGAAAASAGFRDCLAAVRSAVITDDDRIAGIIATLETLLADDRGKSPPGSVVEVRWAAAEKLAEGLRELLLHDSSNPILSASVEALVDMLGDHKAHVALTDDGIKSLKRRLIAVAGAAQYLALSMDFAFLMDKERQLLSIGYTVDDGALDESCYDLLASEARLASFFAVAKGDLPAEHWFRLSRALLPLGNSTILTSWSGSMFEYLMPELLHLTPRSSLLGCSIRHAVDEHMRFGNRKGTPWGISESAYNVRDLEFTYQYSGFGVPHLGLKRGLDENHVVAPYATGLASMLRSNQAARNFDALEALGGRGAYGFYEAIDFTPARIPQSIKHVIVKAYMSHHQGMTIAAIANAVLDDVLAKYFHQSPIVQAAELLLQERAPRLVPKFIERATLLKSDRDDDDLALEATRRITTVNAPRSESHVIGNGRLSVAVSASGSGATTWNGLAITRLNTDNTLNDLGSYIYLRDASNGSVWSAGYQPVCASPEKYEALFSEDRIRLSRTDGKLETATDFIVSPEDDVTCRRVSITNKSKSKRTIDITSYEEIVLGSGDGDAAHPAFSKLFIETRFDAGIGAVIAHRRARGPQDRPLWAAAFATCDTDDFDLGFETDRAIFVGMGRTLASPISVIGGRPLKNTVGAVLDPIFALRRRVTVPPGGTVRICFWSVLASSLEALAPMREKYADKSAYVRSATLAWTVGRVELRHLGVEAEDAMDYQRLAAAVLASSRRLRPAEAVLQKGQVGFDILWSTGVSGDLPVVLLQIEDIAELGLVRQCLHGFEYWRRKGIEIDLVVLNAHEATYQNDLQHALETLVNSVSSRHRLQRDNAKGEVYLLRADLLNPDARSALESIARAILVGKRGSLSEQLDRGTAPVKSTPLPRRLAPTEISFDAESQRDLEFFNGYGGFQNSGCEYTIVLNSGRTTPAPWINVISNPDFGFQVSAEGAGYTWSVNSRERQLTPWANDPVVNRPGEVFYIKDEETGELWTPTASPIRDHAAPYTISHGQGYTRFEHASRGIEVVLEQFVATDDPVKISRLLLRNVSGRPRKLSVTSYVEWVLGTTRRQATANLTTSFDAARKAIFCRNPWHQFFPDRVSFSAVVGDISSWTADRADFIGHCGQVDNPAGLSKGHVLSRSAGTGLDPCAALMTTILLPPLGEKEIVGLLGDGADLAAARALVEKYARADVAEILASVARKWDDLLDRVQIKTPDRGLDLLFNRWLPYQTLSSRIWARAGLYQAGGAYGYRDQLQDVMSLAATKPQYARQHILAAAGRQFPEGDVQHWWLAPSGHGIRTRISDSCLWLPFVTAHYVRTAGEPAILDEEIAFIDGQELQPHEHEVYMLPVRSSETGSLYEHCARALDRSLLTGPNGLALFGGGDWNDGMNRVGIDGRGESVWLSWFLIKCLRDFIPFAEAKNDTSRAAAWSAHIENLNQSLDANAWDGSWYRRGYFDDGTPLGSASNEECRIDSIAQSWSVISAGTDRDRAREAMRSVQRELIDTEQRLIMLFTPPFDHIKNDPGYIKGYPPGIRENGGQYTHAAAWAAIALAELGDGDGAGQILSLLNPVNLSATDTDCRKYRLEPYVIAADVYSVGSNAGRGGWSWYTGSAGWYYRAVLEYLLGIRKEGDTLIIKPTIPSHWEGFEVNYLIDDIECQIVVENPSRICHGIIAASTDGKPMEICEGRETRVKLTARAGIRRIEITMGIAPPSQTAN